MKKQIIKIALYDGWVPTGNKHPFDSSKGMTYKKKGKLGVSWLEKLPYATNLNELHRVALDVCGELFMTDGGYELGVSIGNALLWRPVRKQYTHLIKAVADGIDYLNTHRNA